MSAHSEAPTLPTSGPPPSTSILGTLSERFSRMTCFARSRAAPSPRSATSPRGSMSPLLGSPRSVTSSGSGSRYCGSYLQWWAASTRICVSRRSVNEDAAADQEASPRFQSQYWRTEFHKACWTVVSTVNFRTAILPRVFPDTVCFYDPAKYPGVKRKVALTIDDAPCKSRSPDDSMIKEVLAVLKEFDAHATFFLCTDYVQGHEGGLREAIAQGHEVANHCPEDRSYAEDAERDFEAAFLRAESVCNSLRDPACRPMASSCSEDTCQSARMSEQSTMASESDEPAVRWFRAPHGRLSPAMKSVIARHGFKHVLCDCYANDPWINDSDYIARTMLDSALDGSVAVIHMPERGFREYNFLALRQFLKGLKDRDFQTVSLSQMHAEAMKPVALTSGVE